jgi:hypothetical protein
MAVASAYPSGTAVPYRMSMETVGLFSVLLGAWAGIVPYVGPIFGFSADGSASWTWNLAHSLLFLLPGAGILVAGLLMMVEGASHGPARSAVLSLAAMLALLCGAWLIVGPVAWRAIEGSNFFTPARPLTELGYWIGYSLGPGGLAMAFGAFVLGRPHRNQVVASAPAAVVDDRPPVVDAP